MLRRRRIPEDSQPLRHRPERAHRAPAHLGLGRAYALSGNSSKARAKYQDFLELWKDADPDTPILKQAKREYAKLQ